MHAAVPIGERWQPSIVMSVAEIRTPDTHLTGLIMVVDLIDSGSCLTKVHGPMDRPPWTYSTGLFFRKIIRKFWKIVGPWKFYRNNPKLF
jgi:hypothetical protein